MDGQVREGQYSNRWDGRDEGGKEVPAGIYFFRLNSGIKIDTEKVVLLR